MFVGFYVRIEGEIYLLWKGSSGTARSTKQPLMEQTLIPDKDNDAFSSSVALNRMQYVFTKQNVSGSVLWTSAETGSCHRIGVKWKTPNGRVYRTILATSVKKYQLKPLACCVQRCTTSQSKMCMFCTPQMICFFLFVWKGKKNTMQKFFPHVRRLWIMYYFHAFSFVTKWQLTEINIEWPKHVLLVDGLEVKESKVRIIRAFQQKRPARGQEVWENDSGEVSFHISCCSNLGIVWDPRLVRLQRNSENQSFSISPRLKLYTSQCHFTVLREFSESITHPNDLQPSRTRLETLRQDVSKKEKKKVREAVWHSSFWVRAGAFRFGTQLTTV